ncbi:MAG: hypothetical protein KAH30_01260 [Caldisericia bacterium]|nr:hypothetical protein [Caldisericia bacterium]
MKNWIVVALILVALILPGCGEVAEPEPELPEFTMIEMQDYKITIPRGVDHLIKEPRQALLGEIEELPGITIFVGDSVIIVATRNDGYTNKGGSIGAYTTYEINGHTAFRGEPFHFDQTSKLAQHIGIPLKDRIREVDVDIYFFEREKEKIDSIIDTLEILDNPFPSS